MELKVGQLYKSPINPLLMEITGIIDELVMYSATTPNGSIDTYKDTIALRMMEMFLEQHQYTLVSQPVISYPIVCTCSTFDMTNFGCKCGAIQREREARR